MNKSITKFTLFFALLGIAFLSSGTMASNSVDYYKELFRSWNLTIDTIETQEDTAGINYVVEPPENVNTIGADSYLLLLSSQKLSPGFSYRNIILICDTDDLLNSALPAPCTYTTLRDINFSLLKPDESITSNILGEVIRPVVVGGVTYYVVPEILLVTPEYRLKLGNYFKALADADKVTLERGGALSKTPVFDTVDKLRNSSILEGSIYAFALLTVVLLAGRLLVLLGSRSRSNFTKELFVVVYRRPLNFIRKNFDVIIFIFFIISTLYIPIIYALGVRGALMGDSGYAASYILNTLNPTNFPQVVMSKNIFKLGFLGYNYILGIFAVLVTLPSFISIIGNSVNKFRAFSLKNDFIKWAVVAVMWVTTALLAFVEVENMISFLIGSLSFLMLSLVYMRNRKIVLVTLFNKKEGSIIIASMVLTLTLNITYPIYLNGTPIKYSHEPLIGLNKEIVLFPYSKKWGKNVLFRPHFYNGISKVFADGYLTYNQGAQKIINRPLSAFEDSGNFAIISGKIEPTIEILLRNPGILPLIQSNSFSTIFSFADFAGQQAPRIALAIICTANPEPATINLEIYSLGRDEAEQNAIITESIEILKFPGCSSSDGTKIFEVPLGMPPLHENFVIARVVGTEPSIFLEVKLVTGDTEIPLTFLNKDILNENKYSILYQTPGTAKFITSYSADVEKEFPIDVKTTEEGFDLSAPINELMKMGVLNNPFIIWTDQGIEVIQR